MMETRTRRGRRGVSIVGLKVARIRALLLGMWVFGLSQWVSLEILRGFQPSVEPRYPRPPTIT